MKTVCLLCCLLLCFFFSLMAQPGNNLSPTASRSLTIIQLRDFSKKPIPKAPVAVTSAQGAAVPVQFEGKTDKNGNWECLLPIDQAYWIAVGDSQQYSQLTIPNKPFSATKHSVYFQGSLNGKPVAVGVPTFNMMPPSDGFATISMEFMGLQDQPLVREKVTLTADGSKKVFEDSTDANGKLTMKVPIGENYTMTLPYNSRFDHFEFPAHGGSYQAKVRYKYAGKRAIEAMRAERLAHQASHDAYFQLPPVEQRKVRDVQSHKLIFNETPVEPVGNSRLTVEPTAYGFALKADYSSPMMTPYYVDGLLISGSGWSSHDVMATDAATGEFKWGTKLLEGGVSNIEGDDSVIVCATESCTIYAIAAHTGALLWSKWLAAFVLSAPCVDQGKVYISYEDRFGGRVTQDPSHDFVMACFDLHTGAIIWQQWIKGEVMSAAVAHQGRLYFNTFAGFSYIMNATDGAVIASQQQYATSAPSMVGDDICFSQRDATRTLARERIALYDGKSLSLIKATAFGNAPYLDPEALQRTQYASTNASLSLTTGSGSPLVQNSENIGPKELVGALSIFATQSWEGSRPLGFNGRIYVAQGPVLRCLDPTTMMQVWEWQYPTSLQDDGGACISPPIAVDGKVAVACMDGGVRLFDPSKGTLVKHYTTGEKHRFQPIAAEGNFYAPCVDGKLAVVRTGNPSIKGWNCWGGNAARTNAPE